MIVLYNPLSTTPGKQPLPLSVMALAAVLEGHHAWTLVDGNVIADPAAEIIARLSGVKGSERSLLAVTVMPGPQLTQAVAVCRAVRHALPHVPIVWGGYFPTQHTDTVLRSSFVDFVVRSQGERALAELIDVGRTSPASARTNVARATAWHAEAPEARRRQVRPNAGPERPGLHAIAGLSWKDADGRIVHNPIGPMTPLDELPDLPYARVDMRQYIHPTYLGRRTVAHNSSFGCPFSCSFCAVVAMTNRRWLAQSPARMERVIRHLVDRYHVDAVQMHDMDFFISEARVAEFAGRIAPLGISWWGLGRVDTLMQYSDATWHAMARSGLKMVFSGAESASDTVLAAMNKGGKASAKLPLELAKRMKAFGVVPEYSFVLGSPPDPLGDMQQTFDFIRDIKRVNPATEIVLYTYTPVPMDGTLYSEASRLGFVFPTTLDEWASDRWRQVMMRRGEGIPWFDGSVRRRVRNFERVLNAFYPTVTDSRLTPVRRALLRAVSGWRYALKVYSAPLELRALHRLIRYQRPETTGF
jgi:anaerobic magnesium-protoporphyrin IX monomethyl ester cyclase